MNFSALSPRETSLASSRNRSIPRTRCAALGSTALVGVSVAATVLFLSIGPVQAQVLDWSPNDDLNGGDGDWDTVTDNWSDDGGTTFVATFADGDQVNFFDGNGGTSTVTITGTVAPELIEFDSSGFTVTGGTLDVSAGDANLDITVNIGETATILSDFTGTGDINVLGGATLIFENVELSNVGELNVAGTATLDITGALTTNSTGLTLIGEIDGDVDNTGTLTVGAGGATVNGDFENLSNGSVTVDTGTATFETVTNTQGTITVQNGGTLAATANSITNDDTINLVDGTLSDAGTITNNDTINVSGTSTIESTIDESIVNSAGAVIEQTAGDLTINGDITNAGELTFSGTTVDATGDTLTNNDPDAELNLENAVVVTFDSVTNTDGDIDIESGAELDVSTGGLALDGGELDNAGTITGDVTVDGGELDNDGTIDGNLGVASGEGRNDGTVTGDVDFTGGTFENRTGADVQGTLTVNAAGLVAENDAGASLGGVIVTNGTLENDGDITGAVDVQGPTGALINAGTIDFTGQSFTNDGIVTNETGASIDGDTDLTVTGGTFTNEGGVNISGNTLVISGTGTVEMDTPGQVDGSVDVSAATANLTGGGTITESLINSGTTTVEAGRTLTADDITNNTTIAVQTGGTLEATTGPIDNDGTITVAASGSVIDAGTLDNSGTIEFTGATGTAALQSNGGDLNNTGSIELSGGGNLTVTGNITGAGDVSVDGGGTLTGDDITLAGAAELIVTDGTARFDAVNNTSGAIDVQTNGTLEAATVTNSGGTLDNDGTIDAAIQMDGGTFTNTGTTTGDVAADGGVTNNSGTMEGALVVDGGDFNNLTGGVVEGDLDFDSGSVSNDGTMEGEVDVASGATFTNETGGVVEDDLISAGTSTNDGTVQGNVSITGGTFGNSGTLAGAVSLTAGSLTNTDTIAGIVTVGSAASFTNDTTGVLQDRLVTEGTTANRGTIEDDVTILDGTTTNESTGTMEADVYVQSGGTLQNDGGSIDGNLTNNMGGTVEVGTGGLSDVDTLQNSGTINIAAGQTLAADTIENEETAGIINVGDGATLQGLANTLNNDGVINVGVDGVVTDAGAINNNAPGEINFTGTGGTATLASTTAGTISNAGDLNVDGGSLDITGDITNSGTFTIDTEATELVAGEGLTITVTGLLDIDSGDASFDDVTNTGGTVEIASGSTLTAPVTTSGTLNNDGTIEGAVSSSGTTGNTGTIDGTLGVTAGTTTNSGDVTGATTVASGATLSNTATGELQAGLTNDGTTDSDGTITGDVTNTATLDAENTITGNVTNSGDFTATGNLTGLATVDNDSGGTFDVSAGTTDVGTVFNNDSGATLTVQAGAELDSSAGTGVNNDGTLTNAGTLTGDLNNSGTLTSTDTITGNVTNSGTADVEGTLTGDITNTGTFTATDSLTGLATVDNDAGGTFVVSAGTTDVGTVLNNDSGATLSLLAGATLNGDVTNAGTANAEGTLSGVVANTGTFNAIGNLAGITTFSNLAGGIFDVGSGVTVDLATLGNAGTTRLASGSQLGTGGAAVTNAGAGTIAIEDVAGTVTIDGDFTNNGTLRFTGSNVNRTLDVTGDYGGSGRVFFATNFSGDAGQRGSSTISADDISAGTVVRVNLPSGQSIGGSLGDDLVLVESTSGATVAFTTAGQDVSALDGLQGGPVAFVLTNDSDGNVVVQSSANTGVAAALAGNLVLTQTIASTIVNRPNSPAVDTLYYDDEDGCSPGSWARVQGGQVKASAATTNTANSQTVDDEIEASYYGVQGGADFGCYEAFSGGWDLTGGVFFGVNSGSSVQDIQSPDAFNPGEFTRTGRLHTDFDQFSLGAYLAFSKGRMIGDLQLRYDQTYFSFTDEAFGNSAGLGLDKEEASSSATTLAGSLSYFFALEDLNIGVVPTVGFAYTRTSSTEIDLSGNTTLEAKSFDTQLGFVGLTVGRSNISEDFSSGSTISVSGTVYHDFAGDRDSEFRDGNASQTLTSENLGTFGELSVGYGYFKLLGDKGPGGAKQFQAGLRADYRFSDDLQGYGVTGFIRLQF